MARLSGQRRGLNLAWVWAVLALVIVGVLAWFLAVSRQSVRAGQVGPGVGQVAPNVQGKSLTGVGVDLWRGRGKAAVVSFWSPAILAGDKAVQAEARLLAGVQQRLSSQVQLIGVLHKEPAVAGAAKVAGKWGLLYPTLNDPNLVLAQAYGVDSVPATFFIDKAGVVRSVQRGALTRNTLSAGLMSIGVRRF